MTLFRNLLVLIVLAIAGALLGQLLLREPGYVLVRYGGNDYTTTVAAAIAILLGTLLVAWLLWTLVSLPFRSWRARRDHRAWARLGEGLDALHAGHYARAEKTLSLAAQDDFGAAARVAAAQAALGRDDRAAARAHLDVLVERHAPARAIALAELALADGLPIDALAALDDPAAQPEPPRALALRAQALIDAGQGWEAYGLLGALQRQDALAPAALASLERAAAQAGLRQATDGNALAARWEALPASARHEPAITAAYAEQAAALGWNEAAARSIEQALDARWDNPLAMLYGLLDIGRFDARRTQVDRWRDAQPGNPALAFATGCLASGQGDWVAADAALREAIDAGVGAPAWEALGRVHAAQGDAAASSASYANAVDSARGATVVAPWQHAEYAITPDVLPPTDPALSTPALSTPALSTSDRSNPDRSGPAPG